MFKVTPALVQEMLDDDPSLNTLKNQFSVDEIYNMLEDKEEIGSDEELYQALLDVMYATRPQGVV